MTATSAPPPAEPTRAQQPPWPDHEHLARVVGRLAGAPPLVIPEECDQLRTRLAAAARGESFILQGGDCAETFARVNAEEIRDKIKTLLQMGLVLSYAGSVPVVRVGRMAGQFGKPRSHPTEERAGVALPVYRGDAVNGLEFTAAARTPDPDRLERMYQASAATLNVVRAFTGGGYADLHEAHAWNQDFVRRSPSGRHYELLAREMDRALRFLRCWGAVPPPSRAVEFYASHEALLLDYEQALVRPDPAGACYDLSAHLVWIGERTRGLDGAHIAFAAGIRNPIAVKLGPGVTPDEMLRLADRLDPEREPGRLSFIIRMGAERVRDRLPVLVEKARAAGVLVTWICDPMHGNTFVTETGHKSLRFDDIVAEVQAFFEVHRELGSPPGGLHIELTGEDVTECVGGSCAIGPADLPRRYETACDPRLNRGQSLDLAFLVGEMLRDRAS